MNDSRILDYLCSAGFDYLTGDRGIWIGTDARGNDKSCSLHSMADNQLINAYQDLTDKKRIAEMEQRSSWKYFRELDNSEIKAIIKKGKSLHKQKKKELKAEMEKRGIKAR